MSREYAEKRIREALNMAKGNTMVHARTVHVRMVKVMDSREAVRILEIDLTEAEQKEALSNQE